MSLLEKLAWRYATKKFDTAKKIPADKLQLLLDTVRLAPSSFGLQHYKIIVVEDAETRAKLQPVAYGQPQITDASEVIVFAAELVIDNAYVQDYINNIAATRGIPAESLDGMKQYLTGALSNMNDEQKLAWSHKQAYIALGILVAAAAELGIDICPMEGFNAAEFDEILGLKEQGVTASVIATIGYRAEDDATSKFAKVRKPAEDLFIRI